MARGKGAVIKSLGLGISLEWTAEILVLQEGFTRKA
jgi:hypothetical protein